MQDKINEKMITNIKKIKKISKKNQQMTLSLIIDKATVGHLKVTTLVQR